MSIAKQVNEWIEKKPYIRFGLQKDIINQSAITRIIQEELNINNFNAVQIAVRRYSENKIKKENADKIYEILADSKLEIRTGYNTYLFVDSKQITKEIIEDKNTHIIKGNGFITIISDKKFEKPKESNLVEIRIRSPKEIKETSGVHLEILNIVANYEINLIESYSCHTDTVMIIEKKDLVKTLSALEELGIK